MIPWTVWWGFTTVVCGLLRFPKGCSFSIFTWGRGLTWVAGQNIVVSGLEKLKPGQPYIFLSNHQSALDIPIFYKACVGQHDIRFMAKESLFKIPFMGWGMSLSGFIPIRRENARHSAEIFQELKSKLASLPYSYIVFPEGTRSPDGRLQPFKKGSIGIALRLGLPVVPVTIANACHSNPKASFKIRGGTVQVVFHEPIVVSDAEGRGVRDEITKNVYNAVLSALPEDQRPLTPMPESTAAKTDD